MNTTPRTTFAEALLNVLNISKGYRSYKGRARRSEFWYTTLICAVMSAVIDGLGYWAEQNWGYSSGKRILFDIAGAYFMIVNYSCLCRRMHDIGRSCLLPGLTLASCIATLVCLMLQGNAIADTLCVVFGVITALLLAYALFLCTKDSDKGKNRYGYSDKYVDPDDNPSVINKFWEEYGNDMLKRHN